MSVHGPQQQQQQQQQNMAHVSSVQALRWLGHRLPACMHAGGPSPSANPHLTPPPSPATPHHAGRAIATTGCEESVLLDREGASVHGGSMLFLGPGDPLGEMAFFTETPCLEVRHWLLRGEGGSSGQE